jgi:hypothetical protein
VVRNSDFAKSLGLGQQPSLASEALTLSQSLDQLFGAPQDVFPATQPSTDIAPHDAQPSQPHLSVHMMAEPLASETSIQDAVGRVMQSLDLFVRAATAAPNCICDSRPAG